MTLAEVYVGRRERVSIQVFERWIGDAVLDEAREAAAMAQVRRAADLTFRGGINDLDWEAAALRYLEETV